LKRVILTWHGVIIRATCDVNNLTQTVVFIGLWKRLLWLYHVTTILSWGTL